MYRNTHSILLSSAWGSYSITTFELSMKSTIIAAATAMAISLHSGHAASTRPIQIKNDSGQKTEVYWLSPDGEMELVSEAMLHGQTLNLVCYSVENILCISEAVCFLISAALYHTS